MRIASGVSARAGSDRRSRTDAGVPEPADGPVGTLRAAVFVLARPICRPRTTRPAGQFDRSDRADRDAITGAAPALRRLAVLT